MPPCRDADHPGWTVLAAARRSHRRVSAPPRGVPTVARPRRYGRAPTRGQSGEAVERLTDRRGQGVVKHTPDVVLHDDCHAHDAGECTWSAPRRRSDAPWRLRPQPEDALVERSNAYSAATDPALAVGGCQSTPKLVRFLGCDLKPRSRRGTSPKSSRRALYRATLLPRWPP